MGCPPRSRASSTTPPPFRRCTRWPPRARSPCPRFARSGSLARSTRHAARLLHRPHALVHRQGGARARTRASSRSGAYRSMSGSRMRPAALAQTIAADRARGDLPLAVVATVGTTSSTSIDPVRDDRGRLPAGARLAARGRRVRGRHGDGARRGATSSTAPTRADSLVVNPHKWLFTPFDLSALYCRRMDVRARRVLAGARVPRRPRSRTRSAT